MISPKTWKAGIVAVALAVPTLALAAGGPARAEAPRVVVTIKPIHALAASVMDGVGTPALLLSGSVSPHGITLRPSQARLLSEARVVIWAGPALELSVAKIVRNLAGKAVSVPLLEAEDVRLLRLREGGVWEPDEHDHHGENEGDEEEERADFDPHIWLDPHNAIAMTRAIAEALVRADAPNAGAYRANAAVTLGRLKALDNWISTTLRPVRKKRYIVFHDAYQYFEKRYRLTPAGSITIDPHRAPSPRRLYEIRTRILKRGVSCVFREPQFAPKIVNVLVRGTPARVGTLDPVGAALPAGKSAYETLIRRLADSLRTCLTG